MGNRTLLQALVDQAFQGDAETKTAAPKPGLQKIATGVTDTQFIFKLASALDYIVDGLNKEALGDSPIGFDSATGGLPAAPFMANEMGGDEAERQAAGVFPGVPSIDMVAQGTTPITQQGDFAGPLDQPLPPGQQQTDEETPGGESAPGVNYDRTVTGAYNPARARVKAAEERVLGRVKAATLRKAGQGDASVPPPGTVGEPLPPASSSVDEPSVFAPIDSPVADAPQSTESLLDLTNQDADAANKAPLTTSLGGEAVSDADADVSQEDLLEGPHGDGESGAKKAQLASLLNASLLTRIAEEG